MVTKPLMKLVLTVAACLLILPSAYAQTPAADVSAGTFGANTGGGTFNFATALRVASGTPLSTGDLLVVGSGMSIQRFSASAGAAPNVTFTRARGTDAAPTISVAGDETGRFLFRGYDGAAPVASARIGAIVDGTVSGGVVPQAVTIKTSSDANPVERFRVSSDGRVFVGGFSASGTAADKALFVTGNAHVTGTLTGANITATYQDIAEWVPADADLEPGTVVTLHPTRSNEVVASKSPYDTTVAGVVSAQPGISLGIAAPGMEQVATTGRVRVKVDATKGPIKIGDLLVTSTKPGMAMRSEPLSLNGRAIHQPGTVIGKALEPLEGGEGTILVLLSMQ
jgi:hypothetical protein